jgi:hypothetical protein
MERAKPIYIVRDEGGDILPFIPMPGGRVHAIYFSDGSVFDCYNGWRPPSPYAKPIVRVPMGRG